MGERLAKDLEGMTEGLAHDREGVYEQLAKQQQQKLGPA